MPQKKLRAKTSVTAICATLLIGSLGACVVPNNSVSKQTNFSGTAQAENENANAAFMKLADMHASRILLVSPEWATQLGVDESVAGEGFRSRLSDLSKAGNEKLVNLNLELLGEIRAFDRSQLSGTAAVTYDIMLTAYDLAARQNALGPGIASIIQVNPTYAVDQLFGQHVAMPMFFTAQIPVTDKRQLEDYISRLEQLPKLMDDIGDLLEEDARDGVVPPRFVLESISESALGFVAGSTIDQPIVKTINTKIDALSDIEIVQKQVAKSRIQKIVANDVTPAFHRFAERVDALKARSTDVAGIWRLPNGPEMYQVALENYGASGMTADEIHVLGQQDVARIHLQMDAILRGLGYTDGTVGERMQALSKDPDYILANTDIAKEGILRELEGYIEDIMAVAPDWFETVPARPIEVKRVPAYQENSSGSAFYTPPALDGSQPGTFWINLKDTADWPKYTLESLVYHEAVPGHHFQSVVQQEIEDMPLIRNMIWLADYGEGWALYTEELAVEMGMYENDPLGDLGRLRMELYRAARLVVDTGLHDKRWTRQQAIDWMVATTGETIPSITREIDRYSVWPGQATSYKIGMIKFQRIRKKAEQELEEKFDIRAFHNELLVAGPMPMSVLEDRMEHWIEEQK